MRNKLIKEIKEKSSLQQVVSRYITLKRNKGLCPFHPDKHPSFSIHTKKQIWRCFCCGKHGDIFTFIQLIENITFKESVFLLAHEGGIALPKSERFQSYVSRRWKEKKKKLSHLKVSKEIFRQVVLKRYDDLLLERKNLPKKINWDSWDAKDCLKEQIIDHKFDRLDEKEIKINKEFHELKREIISG